MSSSRFPIPQGTLDMLNRLTAVQLIFDEGIAQ